eukprot:TRINITY_DN8475_c0_g1_i1.p1 TRINITY_DN8475_c0_g1~~TRINITY_DN8475_c0_g1_i1.p1  ORF type:complete len:943 (+),score=141.06 TRINITY_DN8475_c0_g1_i1:63-2891(+)
MYTGNTDGELNRELCAGLLDAAFLGQSEGCFPPSPQSSRSTSKLSMNYTSPEMLKSLEVDVGSSEMKQLPGQKVVNFANQNTGFLSHVSLQSTQQQLVANWKTSCGQYVEIFTCLGLPLCAKFSTSDGKPLPPARPISAEGGTIKMMGAVVTSSSQNKLVWSDGDIWERQGLSSSSSSNTTRASLNEMMDRTFGNLAMLEPDTQLLTYVESDKEDESTFDSPQPEQQWEAPPTVLRDPVPPKSCFARFLESLKGCCGIRKSLDTVHIRDLNPEDTLLIDSKQLQLCVKKARNVFQTTSKTCTTKHAAQQLAATLCLALDNYCPGYAAGHRFDLLLAACPEDNNVMYSVLRKFAAEYRNECPSVQGFKKSKVRIVELWWSVDADCSGTLDLDEIISLMEMLNAKVPKSRIKQTFIDFDEDANGSLDFFEFVDMYQFMLRRTELRVVYKTHFLKPKDTNREHTTYDSLRSFFSVEQRQPPPTLSELRKIVNDWAQAEDLEPGKLDLQSFTQYVLSSENSWWDPVKCVTYQDMNRPLSHYYVYSSHNTYLVGNQVGDGSSTRMYRFALRQGVRCVEIDCHDSKDNPPIPVVTHGGAMCSAVTFDAVIKTIAAHAFTTTPYPLIISLENHCSSAVQLQMVESLHRHLSDFLGPSLEGLSHTDPLCTPNALKRKILLRGKSTTSIPQLLNILTFITNKIDLSGKQPPEIKYLPSCDNQKLYTLVAKKRAEMMELTKVQMVRGYPVADVRGMLSANYNKDRIWNMFAAGVQICAMNIQTSDPVMTSISAKFNENGSCGYILKPTYLCERYVEVPCRVTSRLRITIISGGNIPKPDRREVGEIVDPFVSIGMFGCPEDTKKERTTHVEDNGFDPCWNETFFFELRQPEVAMLTLQVYDYDIHTNTLLAEASCPVSCLRQGYRSVPLRDPTTRPLTDSFLLVKIAIVSSA